MKRRQVFCQTKRIQDVVSAAACQLSRSYERANITSENLTLSVYRNNYLDKSLLYK
jgi:hypothetical protein